jgi:hypothetical protein
METMETTPRGILLKGIKRTAAYYQCSVQSIQNLVNDKKIPCYKIGRTRYFYSGEIDEALREKPLTVNEIEEREKAKQDEAAFRADLEQRYKAYYDGYYRDLAKRGLLDRIK